MAPINLKSLHAYLKLLENPAALKRKMPASGSQRTVKEAFSELSRLVGLDDGVFNNPQNIALVLGSQRFVLLQGEPSVSAHVARIFDGSKVLLTVLINPGHFERPMSEQPSSSAGPAAIPNQEIPLQSLQPLLAGNTVLTSRLFRALFEHMLGFASPSNAQQESGILVNELTGSKEHGRSFLATTMFILGAEIDCDNLLSFMVEQRLFGIQIFEQLLQNRDYCFAYFRFRRLERAFVATPAEEEKRLRMLVDQFNAQFGGNPYEAKLFEGEVPDKTRVDAHLAALDLLESMAITPLRMVLNQATAAAADNCVRSLKTIAQQFELFAKGAKTKEQANQEIADHLLAFAHQFSANRQAAPLP